MKGLGLASMLLVSLPVGQLPTTIVDSSCSGVNVNHTLKSPRLSLSRKQKPPHSTISRTISSVGWSPHAFTCRNKPGQTGNRSVQPGQQKAYSCELSSTLSMKRPTTPPPGVVFPPPTTFSHLSQLEENPSEQKKYDIGLGRMCSVNESSRTSHYTSHIIPPSFRLDEHSVVHALVYRLPSDRRPCLGTALCPASSPWFCCHIPRSILRTDTMTSINAVRTMDRV